MIEPSFSRVGSIVALAGCALLQYACNEILGYEQGALRPGGEGGAAGNGGGGGTAGGGGAGGQSALLPPLAWLGLVRGFGDGGLWGCDVGPNGRIALCGGFTQNLLYEIRGVQTATLVTEGMSDIFVLKLEPTGDAAWFERFGGPQSDSCEALAIDALGHTHITGLFQGAVDFGVGFLAADSARTVYLASLDVAGGTTTASQFHGDRASPVCIDVASNGKRWTVGAFVNTISYGGDTVEAGDGGGAFVASETPTESRNLYGIGADGAGDTEDQDAWTVAVRSPDEILVGGRNAGSLIAGTTSAHAQSVDGNPYVAELDDSGEMQRVIGFESTNRAGIHSVATAGNGELVAVGPFENTLTIGTTTVVSELDDSATFIAKLNSDWSEAWVRTLDASLDEFTNRVALDDQGNTYIALAFAGDIDVGGTQVTSEGQMDGLLVAYDPSGGHRFHIWFASSGSVYPNQVALDTASQRVFVAGEFAGALTIHHDGQVLTDPQSSDGYGNAFVAAFDLPAAM